VTERSDLTRVFLWALVGFLALTAALAIVLFLRGDFGETELRLLATTLALGFYSLTGLAGATVVARDWLASFGWLTIVVSAGGLILAVVAIWANREGESEGLAKAALVSLVLSASFAWGSLLLPRRRDGDPGSLSAALVATLAAVAVLAGMLVILILREQEPGDLYFRLLGVVAVLAVLGTLLLPIVRRIGGQARTE
jgi:peptidoglycan biosynthesis protein MviN/MurJ (putative lipid II flippase)